MTISRSTFAFVTFLGVASVALSGCNSARESLGLGRTPPDEFAVVDQPPLSIPPDFGLRPPMPGMPRPQAVDSSERAKELLFGSASHDTADMSAASDGEKALLAQTGGDKAPADIRDTINRESAERVSASPHLVDRLLWWKKDEASGSVVDAEAEAARLKTAKEKGEAANSGATPVIERNKSGWLGM
ncbi:MAG: DUF3035 domain-containing protein [Bdellovibrionales bacterium]